MKRAEFDATMRGYHSRIEILNGGGVHVRYVHKALAQTMVADGAAMAEPGGGKVKTIRLIETASTHAARIGPPSQPKITGTTFARREHLDSGGMVWAHHHRATDYE